MYKQKININPNEVADEDLRLVTKFLLGAIEQLKPEIASLQKEKQALLDEKNKLKSGNARPKFTAKKSRK